MTRLDLLTGTSALSLLAMTAQAADQKGKRPNIILIMADDMGYSDIGCYGGEIPTPNIDSLAIRGIRFTQFYNCGRSCPTRASLLTGLYPHNAGIGAMSEDPEKKEGKDPQNQGLPGYEGHLNRNCVTIAEVLREAGYHTYMAGKWHVGMHGKEKWPLQRGFEHFYGILAGATSYLRPAGGRGLTLDNTKLPPPRQPYYTTDAFTNHAIKFIDSQEDDKPFFLYLAYNAPHWPLQAKDEDIEKMVGKYDKGWQAVREDRHKRMVKLGVIDKKWQLAEWENRDWEQLTEQERDNSALRMAVYAAQVHCMDANIGKLVSHLRKNGKLDNTLIVFLSDNGACAEPYSETGFGTTNDINNQQHWVQPSYGKPWAQVGNTPYRKYKVRAYEGGIATPMIVSWPERLGRYGNQMRDNIGNIVDIMATFVDVAEAEYPDTYHGGNKIHVMAGTSLMPALHNPDAILHDYLYGEHYDNRYVRHGKWKAVKDQDRDLWELYDMVEDRTERHNLSAIHPDILMNLVKKWNTWAKENNVYPKGKN